MYTIKVKYHNKMNDLYKIEKISVGDWIDLRASKNYVMSKGDFDLIDLGISMKLPDGYEAIVAPRSSTFMKYGIIMTNSIGVIDNSYCGDNDIWKMPALAMKDTIIKRGDRICQFRILRNMPKTKILEVENLSNTNRGGFGSTGTK